jgi:ELWxxDGT repeat protein
MNGLGLWSCDGTTAGIQRISNQYLGASSGDGNDPDWAVVGQYAYFRSYTAATGIELWRTDGTTAGTQLVADVVPGPPSSGVGDMVGLGDALVFVTFKLGEPGNIWITRGTPETTVRLASVDINRMDNWHLHTAGDRVYFTARTPEAGWELWATNGTPEGTGMVKDINPGPVGAFNNGQLFEASAYGYELIFAAGDSEHGWELWRTDGSAEGTRLLADVVPGFHGCAAKSLAVVGDRLYFSAYASPEGIEPWVLDLAPPCYANCDESAEPPRLNVLDFNCFLNRLAAGDAYANCDHSTSPPVLNVLDFNCFLNRFAAGCP